jgi:hypothetical protein
LLVPFSIVLAAAAAGPAPTFEVNTTGDKPVRGSVRKLEPGRELVLEDGAVVPVADLVSLRRTGRPLPPWPAAPHLVLNGGDRVVGSPLAIAGPFLHLKVAGVVKSSTDAEEEWLRFPLTSIAALWLRPPVELDPDAAARLFAGARPNDQVVLRNGDVLPGTVTGLDAKKGELAVESGGETRRVALSKVIVVVFSNRLARDRKPVGAYNHLVLTNGTRLTVLDAKIDADVLQARTIYKDVLTIRIDDVTALEVYQGKAVYLSDLKSAKYEYRTYQGERHPWVADRDLAGGEIRLRLPAGDSTFDKGLATHADCQLTFALDGKYKRFEALVGLDAHLGKHGSAEVSVRIDGKEQKIGTLTPEGGPRPVGIDVSGAKELTLVVGWGAGGNVGDYVNWCDARLVP